MSNLNWNQILISLTVLSLLLAGYLFIQNRRYIAAAQRAGRMERQIEAAQEYIEVAQEFAPLFRFSQDTNIKEDALKVAHGRLVELGDEGAAKEWESLQQPDAAEEEVYHLRVRNIFLNLLRGAANALQ